MTTKFHQILNVRDTSQIGEARRAAIAIGQELGLNEVAIGRVALVATELAANLAKHAQQGQLLIGSVMSTDGNEMVEVLSIDHGPGISDLSACMVDGYSTSGTSGTGLGAIRRLSNEFDLFSEHPGGTVILSRVGQSRVNDAAPTLSVNPPHFVFGAIALAAPGETVCGDAWAVNQHEKNALAFVADGLGHGPVAGEAAVAAMEVFCAAAINTSPSKIIEKAHAALRATRGAAVAIAQLNAEENVIIFSGAGNIAARLISGIEDRSLVSQHGTVGAQIRRLQDDRYPWPQFTLLIMHSDGVNTRWNLEKSGGLLQRHPSIIAAWLIRDHCRGRDDATILVIKRRGA